MWTKPGCFCTVEGHCGSSGGFWGIGAKACDLAVDAATREFQPGDTIKYTVGEKYELIAEGNTTKAGQSEYQVVNVLNGIVTVK